MDVRIQEEVIHPEHAEGDWRLCLQKVIYGDGDENLGGYRFIWRRPDGSLQAARGQARIPTLEDAEILFLLARRNGWGR